MLIKSPLKVALPIKSGIRTAKSGKQNPDISPKPLDYAILIYTGWSKSRSHDGSLAFRQLLEMAEEARGSSVAFFAQGYDQDDRKHWGAKRFLIRDGKISDETNQVRGTRIVTEKEKDVEKPSTGGSINLFTQKSFENFLADAAKAIPDAKRYVIFMNAHGLSMDGISSTRVVDGEIHADKNDELSPHALQKSLSQGPLRGKIDLLLLNACLMGGADFFSVLGDSVPYVVAAASMVYNGAIPFPLYPFLHSLILNPKQSVEAAGKKFLYEADEMRKLKMYNFDSIGLYGMESVPRLKSFLNALGELLAKGLENPNLRAEILEAVENTYNYSNDCQQYGEPFGLTIRDLGHFVLQLEKLGVLDEREEAKEAMFGVVQSVLKIPKFNHEITGLLSVMLPWNSQRYINEFARDRSLKMVNLQNKFNNLKLTVEHASPFSDIADMVKEVQYATDEVSQRRDLLPQIAALSEILEKLEQKIQSTFQTSGFSPEKPLFPSEKEIREMKSLIQKAEELLPGAFLVDKCEPNKEPDFKNPKKAEHLNRFMRGWYGKQLKKNETELKKYDNILPGWSSFIRKLVEIQVNGELEKRFAIAISQFAA